MDKRKCPNCNKFSYSSVYLGKWKCPYCRTDMTIKEGNALYKRSKEPTYLKVVSK